MKSAEIKKCIKCGVSFMTFAIISTTSLCKNCLEHEYSPHPLENNYANIFYLRSAATYNISAGTANILIK